MEDVGEVEEDVSPGGGCGGRFGGIADGKAGDGAFDEGVIDGHAAAPHEEGLDRMVVVLRVEV